MELLPVVIGGILVTILVLSFAYPVLSTMIASGFASTNIYTNSWLGFAGNSTALTHPIVSMISVFQLNPTSYINKTVLGADGNQSLKLSNSVAIAGTLTVESSNANQTSVYYDGHPLGVINSSFSGICFQDTANESTACGGLDTGSYNLGFWSGMGNPENTYDAIWSSPTSSFPDNIQKFINIDYAIPSGTTGTTWEVKFELYHGTPEENDSDMNLTLNTTYCNKSSSHYYVQINLLSNETEGYFALSCQQSAGNWAPLYELGNPSNISNVYIYEEGMYWDINPTDSDVFSVPSNYIKDGTSQAMFVNVPAIGFIYNSTLLYVDQSPYTNYTVASGEIITGDSGVFEGTYNYAGSTSFDPQTLLIVGLIPFLFIVFLLAHFAGLLGG